VYQFSNTVLGTQNQPPRWQVCVQLVQQFMPFALSVPYVQYFYNDNLTPVVTKMVQNIQSAFMKMANNTFGPNESLLNLMQSKMNAMTVSVGYPSWINDVDILNYVYQNVSVGGNHFNNVLKLRAASALFDYSLLGTPLTKANWTLNPTSVSVVYQQQLNLLEISAAAIQPPLYFTNGPSSINYGALGSFIGMAIASAFDFNGMQYNPQGNLQQWVSAADLSPFNSISSQLINQYNNYCPGQLNGTQAWGVCVNGTETLNMNFDNQYGMEAANIAYQTWLESSQGDPVPAGLTLTPQQLFYLAFAQNWCSSLRLQGIMDLTVNSDQSPPEFSVNGVISRSPNFTATFCTVGPSGNSTQSSAASPSSSSHFIITLSIPLLFSVIYAFQ